MLMLRGHHILEYVLATGMQHDITNIVIIINSNGRCIQQFVGDVYCGVKVDYVIQREQLGLADAVFQARPYVKDWMLIINGDEIFLGGNHSTMYHLLKHYSADAVVGYIKTDNPDRIRSGYGLHIEDHGRIRKLIEKPAETWNCLLGVGEWLIHRDYFSYFMKTKPNQVRKEKDFVGVIQLMIDDGRKVFGHDLNTEFFNINTLTDRKAAEAALIQAAVCQRLPCINLFASTKQLIGSEMTPLV